MAKKPVVTTLSSGFNSTETLNSNFNNITEAFGNTLSLDGSIPNAMGSDLDLNNNKILNASQILINGADLVSTIAGDVSAAAASAASALTSKNAAAASATSTAADAASIAGSVAGASNSAAAALLSQNAAATSKTNAETASTAASSSAAAALISKNASAASASSATTQATDATTSASAALSSKAAAEAAKDAALAAFDNFDDKFLGEKASDPTTDNDGDPLAAGMLYFNTVDNVMKVYSGAAWLAAYASLGGALLVANNLSDLNNAVSARTNLGLATVASTGAFGDLSGTSAAATAAQGAKADTALQSATGVVKTSNTGGANIPSGTTGQRDASPATGSLRFNSSDTSFEGYNGAAWGSIGGGASGGGSDGVFYENDQAVTTNYTITSNKNAMSTGPVTVNSGITVTVSNGARYVVI